MPTNLFAHPAVNAEIYQCWPGSDCDLHRALRYQYVVTAGDETYPGLGFYPFGSKSIWTGAALPVCYLRDKKNRPIGYVLGIAVAPAGLMRGQVKLRLDMDAADFFDRFEEQLTDIAGRYAFALDINGKTRIYTDPVGMIGAVYNPSTKRVAASPLLTLDGPVEQNPLFDPEAVEHGDAKYGLFHTSDARVWRMNPNCYLDFADFKETRFWPRSLTFDDCESHTQLYRSIAETTAHNFAEIARGFDVALPLSGGHDSRLLLALGRSHLGDVNTAFTHVNNYAGRIDTAIAEQLAKTAGVPFEKHDFRDVRQKPWMKRRASAMYRAASGNAGLPPQEYQNGTYRFLPDNAVVMRGHQTDLLRAVFVFRGQGAWSKYDWQIRRLGMVPTNKFNDLIAAKYMPDFTAWRDGLPECAAPRAVDFMFLETYYSATIGASFPALWRNFFVSPFNSRRLIEWSLQFETGFRRGSMPVYDLTWMANPDLAGIPYDYELPGHGDELIAAAKDQTGWANITQQRITETGERTRGDGHINRLLDDPNYSIEEKMSA